MVVVCWCRADWLMKVGWSVAGGCYLWVVVVTTASTPLFDGLLYENNKHHDSNIRVSLLIHAIFLLKCLLLPWWIPLDLTQHCWPFRNLSLFSFRIILVSSSDIKKESWVVRESPNPNYRCLDRDTIVVVEIAFISTCWNLSGVFGIVVA
jgi:hypothetical protein